MSRLRPYTESDPSSDEARLVRLVRPPPPMSPARAARCKERVTELARTQPVAAKPWGAMIAVGAAAVVTLLGASVVLQRTDEANVGAEHVQTEPAAASPDDNATPHLDEVVPAVSVDSLPSVDPLARPAPKRPGSGGAIGRERSPEPSGATEQDDALTRELRLVDGARLELAAHPEQARALLVRHAADFPSGQLASEREVLLVDVLIRLGRGDEAEAHARSLVAREPGSPYAKRVEALLSSSASKPERN